MDAVTEVFLAERILATGSGGNMEGKKACHYGDSEIHYLSKNVLVLYYIFVSGQKNIKLSTTKLRNKRSAHGRCTLKGKKGQNIFRLHISRIRIYKQSIPH